MGRIVAVISMVSMLLIGGCKSEKIEVISDVNLYETIPLKINAATGNILANIPKGEVLQIQTRYYMKDFLVLEVKFENKKGYVIFDSRKLVITEFSQ